MKPSHPWRLLAITSLLLMVGGADGRVLHASPSAYRELLTQLESGDELRLAPGVYREGLSIAGMNGKAGAPIRIVGHSGAEPSVFTAEEGRNTVSIVDASHIEIRHLVLQGNGLAVDAVKCEGHAHWAHDITLEDLEIVGYGANQQIVGISTKCPAWRWRVIHNVIAGAGTGMYFGDSDGTAPFFDSEIVGNVVVDTLGYELQIKHQAQRPLLPEAGTTANRTVIRGNVFMKTSSAPDSHAPRPNVLLGHWPLSGAGAGDCYVLDGNIIAGNPTEALLQAEGCVEIYNNVFVTDTGDAIHIQPHHDHPRTIRILYNTIIARHTGISVRLAMFGPAANIRIEGNAVFADTPLSGLAAPLNHVANFSAAGRALRAPGAAVGQWAFAPRAPLSIAGLDARDDALVPPVLALDLSGHPRNPQFAGAISGIDGVLPPQLARAVAMAWACARLAVDGRPATCHEPQDRAVTADICESVPGCGLRQLSP